MKRATRAVGATLSMWTGEWPGVIRTIATETAFALGLAGLVAVAVLSVAVATQP